MRSLMVLLIGLALSGCAAQQSGGLGKPTIFSSPVSYVETVGLNIYTRQDVMRVLGNPHNVANIGGKEYWSYHLGEGYGDRTYTYIFKGPYFVDVRYNDNGPYNGITASNYQRNK